MNAKQTPDERHKLRQQRLKAQIDRRIAAAQEERGLLLVLTGDGKGKTTAAFGTVCRAVGHGLKAAVVQFIKGEWDCGERTLLAAAGVEFHVMQTGFTWETQDRTADRLAARECWREAQRLLSDPSFELILLDELTYMLAFDYLPLDEVLQAIRQRPPHQHLIITGRACHRAVLELADTVSEIRNIKHAFDAGIKAQRGIDW
jgi:cob(I)alamin adenosyltransferase